MVARLAHNQLTNKDCGLEKSGLSRMAHNHQNPGSNPGAAIGSK